MKIKDYLCPCLIRGGVFISIFKAVTAATVPPFLLPSCQLSLLFCITKIRIFFVSAKKNAYYFL